MKTESTVKYVLRIALTLLAITAVVAVILAAVNSVTAPRIAAQNEQKTQNAIEAVLPGGGQEVTFTDDTGLVTAAYKGDNGCAVQVTPAGFNGTVTMMVGVDNDGKAFPSFPTRRPPASALPPPPTRTRAEPSATSLSA